MKATSIAMPAISLFAWLICSTPTVADPIHEAVVKGDIAKVRSLIEANVGVVNAHDADDHQATPLHDAALFGQTPIVELLLDHGADVNARDDEGSTPLFKAAGAKDQAVKIAEMLLAKGANLNQKSNLGSTPLHDAVMVENVRFAEFLIDKGARVDARDKEGWTPLFEAATFNKKTDLVKLLLEKNADVNATSRTGLTPLDAAVNSKRSEIAALLRAHGGRSGR